MRRGKFFVRHLQIFADARGRRGYALGAAFGGEDLIEWLTTTHPSF